MRFFFIGLVVIFLVSLLIGQLATPKYTPFRVVMARGLYYTVLGLIGFGVIVAFAALIYQAIYSKGSETDFSRMTPEQREMVRDSLRRELPEPSLDEVKTLFVRFNFDAVVIPCYETVRRLDVAALKEIAALEIEEAGLSDGIYEIQTKAELKVNSPVSGFHIIGDFTIQYKFEEGDSDIDPGWKFDKILIDRCVVLAAEGEEKEPGPEELYPDLPRENKKP
jgi:hypothetical protein